MAELLLTVRAKNLASPELQRIASVASKPIVPPWLKAVGLFYLGYEFRRLASSYSSVHSQLDVFLVQIATVKKVSLEEASQILFQLRDFARTLPFKTSDVIQAWTLLNSAGFPVGIESLRRIADTAFVFNRTMTDVAQAMISQETEVLRRLGVIIQRGQKSIRVSSKNLNTEIEKSRYALFRAIQQSQKAYEGASSQAYHNVQGLVAIFSSEWWEFLANVRMKGFGDYLMATLTSLLRWVESKRREGTLERWAQKISQTLVSLTALAMKGFRMLLESVIVVGEALRDFLKLIIDFKRVFSLKATEVRASVPSLVIPDLTLEAEQAIAQMVEALKELCYSNTDFLQQVERRYRENRKVTLQLIQLRAQATQMASQSNLDTLAEQAEQIKKKQEQLKQAEKLVKKRESYLSELLDKMKDTAVGLEKSYELETETYARTNEERELIRAKFHKLWIEAIEKRTRQIEQLLKDLPSSEKQIQEQKLQLVMIHIRELNRLVGSYHKKFLQSPSIAIEAYQSHSVVVVKKAKQLLKVVKDLPRVETGKPYAKLSEVWEKLFIAKVIIIEGKKYEGFFVVLDKLPFDLKTSLSPMVEQLKSIFSVKALREWWNEVWTSRATQMFFGLFDKLFHVKPAPPSFWNTFKRMLLKALEEAAKKLVAKLLVSLFRISIGELGWFMFSLQGERIVMALLGLFGIDLSPAAQQIAKAGWFTGFMIHPVYGGLIGALIGALLGKLFDVFGLFRASKTIYRFVGPIYSIYISPRIWMGGEKGFETAVTVDHLVIPSLGAQFGWKMAVAQRISRVQMYVQQFISSKLGSNIPYAQSAASIAYYRAIVNSNECAPEGYPEAVFISIRNPQEALAKMERFLWRFAVYYIQELAFVQSVFKALPPQQARSTYLQYLHHAVAQARRSLPIVSSSGWARWQERVYSKSLGEASKLVMSAKRERYYTKETYMTQVMTPIKYAPYPYTVIKRVPIGYKTMIYERKVPVVHLREIGERVIPFETPWGIEERRIKIYEQYITYETKTEVKKIPIGYETRKVIKYLQRPIAWRVKHVRQTRWTPLISPEEMELLHPQYLPAALHRFHPGDFLEVSYGSKAELVEKILPEQIFDVNIEITDIDGTYVDESLRPIVRQIMSSLGG